MKLNFRWMAAAGIAAVAAVPAKAIESPAENPAPPVIEGSAPAPVAPVPREHSTEIAPEQKRPELAKPLIRPKSKPREIPAERASFIGVVTEPIPPALADQLELAKGEGILVRSLMPGGPAAKSGLRVHDIILKSGEIAVGDHASLSQLVIAKNPGDVLTLEILRKGKTQSIEVAVGERPAEQPMPGGNPRAERMRMDGVPDDVIERLRMMMEEDAGGAAGGRFGPDLGALNGGIHRKMDEVMQETRRQLRQEMERDRVQPPPLREFHGSSIVRMKDENGSLEIKSMNGSKQVTVKDVSGKVIWNGPWDSESDKAEAPDEIRKRVESLAGNNGPDGFFQMKLNGGDVLDDGIR